MSWVHDLVAPASRVQAVVADVAVNWHRQRVAGVGLRDRIGLGALRVLQHIAYSTGWVAGTARRHVSRVAIRPRIT